MNVAVLIESVGLSESLFGTDVLDADYPFPFVVFSDNPAAKHLRRAADDFKLLRSQPGANIGISGRRLDRSKNPLYHGARCSGRRHQPHPRAGGKPWKTLGKDRDLRVVRMPFG